MKMPIYKLFFSALTVVFVLLIIKLWNSFIFDESNLPWLFLIMLWSVISLGYDRFPKSLIFSGVTISVIVFVCYMGVRLCGYQVPNEISVYSDIQSNGFLDIAHQLIYLGLFLIAALLYYKKGFSTVLWVIIAVYLLAFIARNSTPDQWSALEQGYNLSPGFVLFSFSPFLFFKFFQDKGFMRFVPHLIFLFCTFWLILLGARGASISLLVFYGCIIIWPVISRNRTFYMSFFLMVPVLIMMVIMLYVLLMTMGQGLKGLDEVSRQIFQKGIASRIKIWHELLKYVPDRFLFGYGTEATSASFVAPAWYWQRNNLDAHSTYFELMLRLGLVGLILYLAVLFNIWRIFWDGREEWVVRVAGSFLIASMVFMVAGEYLIFNTLLRNGFGWIVLGIGAGACLKAKRASAS